MIDAYGIQPLPFYQKQGVSDELFRLHTLSKLQRDLVDRRCHVMKSKLTQAEIRFAITNTGGYDRQTEVVAN